MHNLYKIVVVMALIVFAAVEGALLVFLFLYKKKNDDLPPQIHGKQHSRSQSGRPFRWSSSSSSSYSPSLRS